MCGGGGGGGRGGRVPRFIRQCDIFNILRYTSEKWFYAIVHKTVNNFSIYVF